MASNLHTAFKVKSDKVQYLHDEIRSTYEYQGMPRAHVQDGMLVLEPETVQYEFRTQRSVPRLGVLLVGWGGNNGSTLTASILANRQGISWQKRSKTIQSNYYGSVTQASTIRVGALEGKDVYVPFGSLLPMVHPNDLVIGGSTSSRQPFYCLLIPFRLGHFRHEPG